MDSSIKIFNPDGSYNDWQRLSARIPAFRKAFPAEQGYRVEIEYLDPIEAKPGLKQLYQTTLEAGKTPQDVGLPDIPQGKMIFRATLVSPDGSVLESGSALCAVIAYKDWEKGESAARNRLLAALGFGGDVFDADEDADIAHQGASHQSSTSQQGSAAAATDDPAPDTPSAPDQGTTPDASSEAASAATATAASTEAQPGSAGEPKPVQPALLRQIEHQAKLKGVTVGADTRQPASNEDAKELLKELMSQAG